MRIGALEVLRVFQVLTLWVILDFHFQDPCRNGCSSWSHVKTFCHLNRVEISFLSVMRVKRDFCQTFVLHQAYCLHFRLSLALNSLIFQIFSQHLL